MRARYRFMFYSGKSIRLKGYDYSQEGIYHITICTQNKSCLFGNIVNGEMILNDAGRMIEHSWLALPNRFSNIELDEYIIMPNHMHAIVITNPTTNANVDASTWVPTRGTPTNAMVTIGDVIGAFKSITTNEYIRNVKHSNWPAFDGKIWQRNFYEQIIRNILSLDNARQYIRENTKNWQKDELFVP